MTEYRIHYYFSHGLSRCGISYPKNWTFNTTEVTCGNCKRLLEKEVK